MDLKYFTSIILSLSIISFIDLSYGQNVGETCVNYCIDGTSCLNNICQCPGILEHFATNGQCSRRIGVKCADRRWECVAGSECDTTTDTCTCVAPSIPTENGACSLGFGLYCSRNQTCNSGSNLSCLNNRCVCESGTITEYDPMSPFQTGVPGDCRVKNGGQCTLDGPKCVQNAQCLGGECRCDIGFAHNLNGQCKKIHSQQCQIFVHYQGYSECNVDRGLFCIDDICQCQEPNIWDQEMQACLAPLGEICTGCLDPNALCISKYDFEQRRCKCSPGYVEAQGHCIKDPNMSNCGCGDGNAFDCTGKPCGNYPLRNDPTRFVQCTEGNAVIHNCPSPLEFNADISLCDIPEYLIKPIPILTSGN